MDKYIKFYNFPQEYRYKRSKTKHFHNLDNGLPSHPQLGISLLLTPRDKGFKGAIKQIVNEDKDQLTLQLSDYSIEFKSTDG